MGYWIPYKLFGKRVWHCSKCSEIGDPTKDRCPHCGEKMNTEGDEE